MSPPEPPTRTFDSAGLTHLGGDKPSTPESGRAFDSEAPTVSGPDGGGGADRPLTSCCRFRIEGELGSGGMGVVYRAVDPTLGRDVAVKVLRERYGHNRDARRRFLDEAVVTSQLQHPSIPPVHEIGELPDGRPFLVMKLIRGRTLSELLDERPDPAHDRGRLLSVFKQVCQAVGYAHARGVIHRDLKPSNIMVGAFGEVQVMDWGVAKAIRKAADAADDHTPQPLTQPVSVPNSCDTQAGTILGTPAYMSREQARGDPLDERTDVFSLGAILCHILTGQPPYPGDDLRATIQQALTCDTAHAIEWLGECGAEPEVIALCERCLAADANPRPATAGALAGELVRIREEADAKAKRLELERAAELAQAGERRRRQRTQCGLLAAGLVIGGLLGFVWWTLQRQEDARRAEHLRRQLETVRDVSAAVAEADGLLDLTRGVTDDPVRWEAAVLAARAAVKRADGLLETGEGNDALRGRVGTARARVDQAERDRWLVAQLDEIAFRFLDAGNLRTSARTLRVAGEYAAAFARYGCPTDRTADEFARSLQWHPAPEAVLEGLFDWAWHCRRENDPRAAFVTRAIDSVLLPDQFAGRWWRTSATGPDAGERLAALLKDAPPDPSPWLSHRLFCDLWNHGRRAEANAIIRKAFEKYPSDYRLHARFALCLMTDPAPAAREEAVRHAMACVALRGQSVTACVLLGETLSKDALRPAAAVPWLQRAVDLDPTLLYPKLRLAWSFIHMGRYADAMTAAKKAMETHPDHPEVLNMYGIAAGFNLQIDEAVTTLRKAVKISPDEGALHYNLSGWLLTQGNFTEATKHFLKAGELDPKYRIPLVKPTPPGK